MKIGAAYPTTEVAGDPDAVRKFCTGVEALGFDSLMAYDHVVKCPHEEREPPLTGPYTERDSFHDPFVLFGFAAAITTRLEFSTGVLVLPQRQTALVAQQAADVDLLSRERLRLGIGIGWNHVEYAALGQDFKTRAKRVEEQVDLLRQLWTTPIVSFEGRFDRIDRAGINPRPRRQIPLWMGGHSEPAYERGARIGDGFVFAAPGEGALVAWERVRHHLAVLGRPEAEFGRELLVIFARDKQEAADHLKRWRDTGGTHGTVPSMNKGLGNDVDAHIDYVAEVKRLVDAG
jgi:probable F420-dependent oxidoreductase